jgi:hypothetical protein
MKRGPGEPILSRQVRVVATVIVWSGAMVGSLLIAAKTTVGPVVLDLSANHGVHLGDVLAVTGSAIGAAIVTYALWMPRR